jgi:hypothetical protein
MLASEGVWVHCRSRANESISCKHCNPFIFAQHVRLISYHTTSWALSHMELTNHCFSGFSPLFSHKVVKYCNSVDRFLMDHPSIFFPVFFAIFCQFTGALEVGRNPWKVIEAIGTPWNVTEGHGTLWKVGEHSGKKSMEGHGTW